MIDDGVTSWLIKQQTHALPSTRTPYMLVKPQSNGKKDRTFYTGARRFLRQWLHEHAFKFPTKQIWLHIFLCIFIGSLNLYNVAVVTINTTWQTFLQESYSGLCLVPIELLMQIWSGRVSWGVVVNLLMMYYVPTSKLPTSLRSFPESLFFWGWKVPLSLLLHDSFMHHHRTILLFEFNLLIIVFFWRPLIFGSFLEHTFPV